MTAFNVNDSDTIVSENIHVLTFYLRVFVIYYLPKAGNRGFFINQLSLVVLYCNKKRFFVLFCFNRQQQQPFGLLQQVSETLLLLKRMIALLL